MNRTPIALELPPAETLNPRVAAQIAAIISRSEMRQPVMLGVSDAAGELAPVLDLTAGSLRQRWLTGTYPRPDLWTGAAEGHRRQRFVRIPAAWIEDAMLSGPRAFTRPVPRTVIVRGLANWPELMSLSTVAEALSAGKTSCRELMRSGLLGTVTELSGRPHIRKGALIDHLVRCIGAAVASWKAGE